MAHFPPRTGIGLAIMVQMGGLIAQDRGAFANLISDQVAHLDAPSHRAAVAEGQAGETTQEPGPLPTVDAAAAGGVGGSAEVKAAETTQPLPLPSEGAGAEGAAPATEASGHAEAWLAELPHMNLF